MLRIWLALHDHQVAVAVPRKCASTSIAYALAKIAGTENIKTPQTNLALGPHTHKEVEDMGYKLAMFIRNPYRRIESFWFHVIRAKGCRTTGIAEAGYYPSMTFEQCLDVACGNPYANEHTFPYSACGSAEFYGYMVNLAVDWPRFCIWAGLKNVNLERKNAVERTSLTWTPRMIEIFDGVYARDIALFNAVSDVPCHA